MECKYLGSSHIFCELITLVRCSPGDPSVGYDIIFGPLCLLARSFYSRVTSTRARKAQYIDLPFLEEIPVELDRIRGILSVYERKLVEIFGSAAAVPSQYTRLSSMVRFMRK